MTDTFEDLNIGPALVAGAETLGWDAPAGLQRHAVPVIRRGNNVVLHGSPGSGAVGAYGLGVLDRIAEAAPEPGDPWALVLVPDPTTAAATAGSLARLAGPAGLAVRAMGTGWAAGPVHLLVAPIGAAVAAVQTSTLKLDRVGAIIIDGADLMAGTPLWSQVETLVDAVPGDAQRVLVTGRFDHDVDAFIEGHVRKAMTVPSRTDRKEPAEGAAAVRYAVVTEAGKVDAAAHFLADLAADQVAVVCRTTDRADRTRQALAGRGVLGDGDAHPRVLVLPRAEADQRSVQADVLSLDVPFDSGELDALHGDGGMVLVTPRERSHLLRIAGRAGLRAEAVRTPEPDRTAVGVLRDRIRELARGDLAPELALLEPLLDELPAAEVAAAAIRLARTAVSEPTTPRSASSGPSIGPEPAAAAPPPDAGTWVHLFVGIGHRDDVGPGDIVGAITGEAGVSGDKVGRIDIRESHSTVEVASDVAGKVIQALNGRSLKGRSLRVDYDRKGRTGSGGPGSSGGRRSGGPGGKGTKGGTRGGTRGGGRRPGGRKPRS